MRHLTETKLFAGTVYLTLNAEWRKWDYLILIENLEGRGYVIATM